MQMMAAHGLFSRRRYNHAMYDRWDGYQAWNTHDGPSYYKAQSSTPEAKEPGGSRNRKCMREKMKRRWQEDSNHFEKFFRLKGSAWKHADAVTRKWYTESTGRWKRIPATPTKASSLIMPLRNLLNNILEISEIPANRRLFVTPNPTTMKASRNPLRPPDLLLVGVGPAMTANPTKQLEAKYSCGLVPVRIMLESEFRKADRHLSAAHANEIFIEQDNRRFVYALIITESRLRIYMFDPSGAVVVPRIDYHACPRDFCAVIQGIATLDEVRAGFDTSISLDELLEKRIWTTEPTVGGPPRAVSYRVKSRIFRANRFVGRSTCCWLVEPDDEPGTQCVIKDAWVAPSDVLPELEGNLIRHANKKGVVRGLVRIRHEARLQVPGRSEDTTTKNRRIRRGTYTDEYTEVEDRVHTRIVMNTYGKPLHKFSSRRELLLAFHDAIQAHRDLLLVAGIIHRDISSGNILINSEGEEGDQGILIDLDFAAYAKDVEAGCKLGTFKYMSVALLQNRNVTHNYLHDLEAFYYVICCILCEFEGPGDVKGSHVTPSPEALRSWNSKSDDVAGAAKQRHIEEDFDLPIKPWFGDIVFALAKRFHDFIQCRSNSKFRRHNPEPDPEEDYAEILGHFRWAIDALPLEDDIKPSTQPSPVPQKIVEEPLPALSRKRKLDGAAAISGEPKAKRIALKPNPAVPDALSIAVGRPRRSKANYRQQPVPGGLEKRRQ